MLEPFVNNTLQGMNNPECAFWVGQSFATIGLGYLIIKVSLIYYGLKLLDKFLFIFIPKLYKKFVISERGENK